LQAANVPPNEVSQSAGKKQTGADTAGKAKKTKPDRRLYEDPISDDDDDAVANKASAAGHKANEERARRSVIT
jgi:hypothetical protein